jgi:hypothetical protein
VDELDEANGDALGVVFCHSLGALDTLEDVAPNQAPLPQNLHLCAISFQQLALKGQFLEFDFGHFEQAIDFVARPLEVGDGKGVDRDNLNSERIRHFEDTRKGEEALAVALEGLHPPMAGVATIAVHDERHMFRYRTLA